ncbi:hypothetical protein RFI_12335 [Reticulomyxa filosa]|uniref:RING-type domain-containing protein n=1 Tax=Reticulomyxa filosa TaxID=46433 RepID=X6NFZ6_RETFI|nr:hypothetical protein RFI_12335 [Reticulomyxa filosa]|eukprot:ETO24823.1 hypothetical protein RFI_12335 [Reticulomyxa filosa]
MLTDEQKERIRKKRLCALKKLSKRRLLLEKKEDTSIALPGNEGTASSSFAKAKKLKEKKRKPLLHEIVEYNFHKEAKCCVSVNAFFTTDTTMNTKRRDCAIKKTQIEKDNGPCLLDPAEDKFFAELDVFAGWEEDLCCMICCDIFVRPIAAPCCKQSWCQQCILQWLSYRDTCPHCRTSLAYECFVYASIDESLQNKAKMFVNYVCVKEDEKEVEVYKNRLSDSLKFVKAAEAKFELLQQEQEQILSVKRKMRNVFVYGNLAFLMKVHCEMFHTTFIS